MNIYNTAFTCASVIMNPPSVSYGKVCSATHQLRNWKANENQLFIMVNYFSMKKSIFKKMKQLCLGKFDVIMLIYISLPSWHNNNSYVLW